MKTFHLKDFKSGELPIALNIQRWKKDNVSNEHLHDCVEVIYVLSGNGVNFIDSMTFPTIAGDLYVIARGATHSFYSNTELVFYNLMFQPALFGRRELEYFREHPGFRPLFEPPAGSVLNKLSLPPAAGERIRTLFDRLHAELTGGVPGSQMAAKAYLTLLIGEICRCHEALRSAPSSLSRGDNQFHSLSRIIERAQRENDDRLLYGKLAALAYFLARMHNRTACNGAWTFITTNFTLPRVRQMNGKCLSAISNV